MFLALPEVDPGKGDGIPGSIEIVDASFSWTQGSPGQHENKNSVPSGQRKIVLKNVSVTIAPGELVAVIGEVSRSRNLKFDKKYSIHICHVSYMYIRV